MEGQNLLDLLAIKAIKRSDYGQGEDTATGSR